MKNLWFFLINTFEVNTRGSRRKMLRIANHHLARLEAMKADPLILALLTIFKPAVLLYRSMFSDLDSSESLSMGNTTDWTNLLDEMSETWFDQWQTMIRPVYAPGTPQFVTLFPNGKAPFQSIQYDLRMVAVESFHTTLLTYPALSEVARDVEEKLAQLRTARDKQTERFGTNVFTAGMIEEQRMVLANLLDNNLCDLKKKYRSNIKMVENYFDLAELRKSSTDADARFAFSGTVEAGATAAVLVSDRLVLSANAACSFSNKSNQAELAFFFSASASAADSTIKTTVLPSESAEGTAAESGWAPGTNYIIVKNMGTVTAEYELMMVEAIS